MHRESGRYSSWGVFREQSGKLVVKRASCALLFLLLLSNGKIVTRPFVGKASQSVSQRAKTRVFGDSNVAQLSQLTTMWVGPCAPSRFAPALSRCPPSHFHLAPSMLFLLRQNRVLRPASAWDRGRVIHLILSPQFGYGIPPCEYEVATFVEMEPQPSFMDSPAHPCNNQEAESHRGDKAKGDSIVV